MTTCIIVIKVTTMIIIQYRHSLSPLVLLLTTVDNHKRTLSQTIICIDIIIDIIIIITTIDIPLYRDLRINLVYSILLLLQPLLLIQ